MSAFASTAAFELCAHVMAEAIAKLHLLNTIILCKWSDGMFTSTDVQMSLCIHSCLYRCVLPSTKIYRNTHMNW